MLVNLRTLKLDGSRLCRFCKSVTLQLRAVDQVETFFSGTDILSFLAQLTSFGLEFSLK